MLETTRFNECMTLVVTLTNESYLMSRLVTECGAQQGTVLNLINEANTELASVTLNDANLATLMLLTEKDESTIRDEWLADTSFTPSMTTSITCPVMVASCINSN